MYCIVMVETNSKKLQIPRLVQAVWESNTYVWYDKK